MRSAASSMGRRQFARIALIGLASGAVAFADFFNSNAEAQSGNEFLDSEVYVRELYCFTEDQKTFVNDVLGLVNQGRLPAKLVISCFQWARKKQQTSRRFYYFSYALYTQASAQGILLSKLLGYSTFEPKNM